MFSVIRSTLLWARMRPTRPMIRLFNSESISDEDQVYMEKREFSEMSAEDFKDLFRDDRSGALRSKVETALNEYEFLKYNSNGRVPSKINMDDMRELLEEGETIQRREGLFNYFFKREMAKLALIRNKERLKKEKKLELALKQEKNIQILGEHDRTGLLSEDGNLIYGLWHNSLFPRINEHLERVRFSGNNLSRAALFGRKLIFDFSYDNYMKKHAIRGICEQIQASYGLNRFIYDEPFDIWFCNFQATNLSTVMMGRNYITNLETTSMITAKEGCPTKYFSRDRLVYLSPNATQKLSHVQNSDDVYIIGAYNDKGSNKQLSIRKAEELGIRSRCLPLDDHLAWKGPSKNLCVNHVTGILLELMHNNNNWKEALAKYVPSRKVKPIEEVKQEESYRLEKLKRMGRKNKRFNVFET